MVAGEASESSELGISPKLFFVVVGAAVSFEILMCAVVRWAA